MVFIIGLLFGGFFIGLGIYQLKTKQFITGGRGSGWVSNANPGALLYIFATLEILVGGASIGLVSHMALQRARTAGHCDHQDDKSECSEYFDDWSSDELARVCGEPALPGPCPHNNLLGSCLIDTGCREVDLTFWPGHGFRGALSTRA